MHFCIDIWKVAEHLDTDIIVYRLGELNVGMECEEWRGEDLGVAVAATGSHRLQESPSQSHLPLASTRIHLHFPALAPAVARTVGLRLPLVDDRISCHLPALSPIPSTPTSTPSICVQQHFSLRFSAHHAILTNHSSIIHFDNNIHRQRPTDQPTPNDTPPCNIRPTPDPRINNRDFHGPTRLKSNNITPASINIPRRPQTND